MILRTLAAACLVPGLGELLHNGGELADHHDDRDALLVEAEILLSLLAAWRKDGEDGAKEVVIVLA